MRKRHYIEEIGVASVERPVPTPVAIVVLTLVLIVAAYLVRQMAAFTPSHQAAAEEPAPAKVAHR
jgi:hypothetical protein